LSWEAAWKIFAVRAFTFQPSMRVLYAGKDMIQFHAESFRNAEARCVRNRSECSNEIYSKGKREAQ